MKSSTVLLIGGGIALVYYLYKQSQTNSSMNYPITTNTGSSGSNSPEDYVSAAESLLSDFGVGVSSG